MYLSKLAMIVNTDTKYVTAVHTPYPPRPRRLLNKCNSALWENKWFIMKDEIMQTKGVKKKVH